MAVSLAVHGLALLALMRAAPREAMRPPAERVLDVALAPAARPRRLELPPTAAPARAKVALRASPPRRRGAPAHPSALQPVAVERGASVDAEAIGEAELAGAAVAGTGGGGGGGGCDMAERLQAALQGDRLVRAELAHVAASGPRGLRIWNGDWIAHAGQDGRGLAAVREAIVWEVGFSPPECRREPVRGLVRLVVPTDAGGDMSLALGTGAWRWSDLLRLSALGSPG